MSHSELDEYSRRFSNLHTDRNRTSWKNQPSFRAPHKPVLLLCMMDAFAEGSIHSNLIEITDDLLDLFAVYMARILGPDRRTSLALPFFHLRTDRFWQLLPRPGKEAIVESAKRVDGLNWLRKNTLGAGLDEPLYRLCCLKAARNDLRRVLLETYFVPETRNMLQRQAIINVEAYHYSEDLLHQPPMAAESEARYAADPPARDQGFRRAVVVAYDRRCALCGVRIITPGGHTAVDASHIVPWSETRDDRVNNGLALCRLCHWSFDEGMIAVSASYCVIASPELKEDPNLPGHLSALDGRSIMLPSEIAHHPDVEALAWQKKHVFRAR